MVTQFLLPVHINIIFKSYGSKVPVMLFKIQTERKYT